MEAQSLASLIPLLVVFLHAPVQTAHDGEVGQNAHMLGYKSGAEHASSPMTSCNHSKLKATYSMLGLSSEIVVVYYLNADAIHCNEWQSAVFAVYHTHSIDNFLMVKQHFHTSNSS